ncbi:MAG: YdeI/OmpD-associated family protein [Candidatus Acidiferrum sp.]
MKLARRQKIKLTIRFRARLLESKGNEKSELWRLSLPKSASAKLPSRGTTMVEGTINSLPFRAALEPDGKGSHWLAVNKAMRAAADAESVDPVTVEIARAGEEAELRVPMDLRKALAADALAQAGWEGITPMARRDWIFSISSAKQPETRKRRIEKACNMLASGKRRLCCFPGVKWIMRENEKSCGMWLTLPDSQNRSSQKTAK